MMSDTLSLHQKGRSFIFNGGYHDRFIPKDNGFQWSKGKNYWHTTDPSKALRVAEHEDVEVSSTLIESIRVLLEQQVESINLSRASDVEHDVDIPKPIGKKYYPFQKAGIQFALSRPATLIGDEMGIGKTIQAIGVINADTTIKSALVICPASLRLNWKRELLSWLVRPLNVGIAEGKSWPEGCDIVVINYDILAKNMDMINRKKWGLIIVDEAHYIKNPKSNRSKLVVQITNKIPRKIFLTGTPVPNKPVEGWPIFNALAPDVFSSFWKYAQNYCDAHQGKWGWDMSGASNLDELQRELRGSIMVRRLKKDVLTELPAKTRQVILLPVNGLRSVIAAEQAALREFKKKLIAAKKSVKKLKPEGPLYKDAVETLKGLRTFHISTMSIIRKKTAVAKIPYVIEHVKAALEEQSKIVVMAHHHDVVDGLAKGLAEFGVVKFTGRDSMTQKDKAVSDFQTGSARVFIGSIQAAGVGLTLTAASMALFAELDWVPGNISQAEDRLHRIGQENGVLIQHIVIDESIDANMAQRLVEKQAVLDAMLDDNNDAKWKRSKLQNVSLAEELYNEIIGKE
jgi:SWI/SNF-related matrix-associated actin-dependent regulator 1 of chromatin subfamily A